MKPPDKSKFQAIAHEAEAEDTYECLGCKWANIWFTEHQIWNSPCDG